MRPKQKVRVHVGAWAMACLLGWPCASARAQSQPEQSAQARAPQGPTPSLEEPAAPKPVMPYPVEPTELEQLRGKVMAPAAIKAEPLADKMAPAAPQGFSMADKRLAEMTYWGFVDRYDALAAAERAEALERGRGPSSLPWLSQAAGYWSGGFASQRRFAQEGYATDGSRMMDMAASASSWALGAAVAGLYETVAGRVFEWVFGRETPEDKLEAAQARKYADFVKVRAWSEYDFGAAIELLWTVDGRDFSARAAPRRWERKVWLSAKWGVQAVAAWLASQTGKTDLETAKTTTLVLARAPSGAKQWRVFPRHGDFGSTATSLASAGYVFDSIGGHTGSIVVSIVAQQGQPMPELGQRELFRQGVSMPEGANRVVLEMPVASLAPFLAYVKQRPAVMRLEEVFDY